MTTDTAVPIGSTRTARRLRASRPLPVPPATFDREYWLAHCEGFRVDGASGRLGFVEEVRDGGGSPVLAVRAGLLGRRLLLVPGSAVDFIVPRAERIWLYSPFELEGTEAA